MWLNCFILFLFFISVTERCTTYSNYWEKHWIGWHFLLRCPVELICDLKVIYKLQLTSTNFSIFLTSNCLWTWRSSWREFDFLELKEAYGCSDLTWLGRKGFCPSAHHCHQGQEAVVMWETGQKRTGTGSSKTLLKGFQLPSHLSLGLRNCNHPEIYRPFTYWKVNLK